MEFSYLSRSVIIAYYQKHRKLNIYLYHKYNTDINTVRLNIALFTINIFIIYSHVYSYGHEKKIFFNSFKNSTLTLF